jgi:outer membrane biogenesis lipoprotein LolB
MNKTLLVLAGFVVMLLAGCTVRATVDASMFQKYDRPKDAWTITMESKEDKQTTTTEVKK